MRACWRKSTNDKFQPCQDEIDYLRDSAKGVALCHTLRHSSLTQFYMILHPGDVRCGYEKSKINLKTVAKNLKKKNSIFHIHSDSEANDVKEYRDLCLRAEKLA